MFNAQCLTRHTHTHTHAHAGLYESDANRIKYLFDDTDGCMMHNRRCTHFAASSSGQPSSSGPGVHHAGMVVAMHLKSATCTSSCPFPDCYAWRRLMSHFRSCTDPTCIATCPAIKENRRQRRTVMDASRGMPAQTQTQAGPSSTAAASSGADKRPRPSDSGHPSFLQALSPNQVAAHVATCVSAAETAIKGTTGADDVCVVCNSNRSRYRVFCTECDNTIAPEDIIFTKPQQAGPPPAEPPSLVSDQVSIFLYADADADVDADADADVDAVFGHSRAGCHLQKLRTAKATTRASG